METTDEKELLELIRNNSDPARALLEAAALIIEFLSKKSI